MIDLRGILARVTEAVQARFAHMIVRMLGPDALDARERLAIHDLESIQAPERSFIHDIYVATKGDEGLTSDDLTSIRVIEEAAGRSIRDVEAEARSTINNFILTSFRRQKHVSDDTSAQIIGKILDQVSTWLKDLDRNISTIIHSTQQQAKLGVVRSVHGAQARVYKVIAPDACDYCRELHTDEDGSPRIFSVDELEGYGDDNTGRSKADWLPVIGSIHPHCRCTIAHMPDGHEFDEDGNLVEKSLNAELGSQESHMGDRAVGTGTSGANIKWGVPNLPVQATDPSMLRDELEAFAENFDEQPMLRINPGVFNFRDSDVKLPLMPLESWRPSAEERVIDLEIMEDTRDWLERRLKQRAEAGEAANSMVHKSEVFTISE